MTVLAPPRPAPGSAQRDRSESPAGSGRGAPGAGWAADAALAAVGLAVGLGAARLVADPGRAELLVPIGLTVVAGHIATSLSRRLRAPAPAPVAWGVVAVVLSAVWTVLPGTTWHGVPTLASLTELAHLLRQANHILSTHSTPVPPASSVTLLFTVITGLVAVGARALWAMQETDVRWRGRPLVSLVPPLGLFAYTSLLSSQRDRLVGAASFVAAAVVFVVVADASRSRVPRLGSLRIVMSGLAAGAVAVAGAFGVASTTGAVTGIHLRAFRASPVGVQTVPVGGGGSRTPPPVQAIDLIDDLLSVETTEVNTLVFTATSGRPTYWQVANLTVFDGTRWLPDGPTAEAAQVPAATKSSAPLLPGPRRPRSFVSHVSLRAWASRLLPAPPDTSAVRGAAGVRVAAGVGVEQRAGAAVDVGYRAVAAVPSDPTSAQPSAGVRAAALEPYLALPPLDPAVPALARQIVRGSASPLAEAEALQEFLTSGRFRYTLDPPPVSPQDPVANFLLDTRAGYCQQFAGAFAVMARSLGLPTRLAVGFTPGLPEGADTYEVTGADAHVWPEVYLGAAAGWVPFEPTPGDGTGLGANPGPAPASVATSPSGVPTTLPATTHLRARKLIDDAPTPQGAASARTAGVVCAVAAVAVAVTTVGWLRRRRRRNGGDGTPGLSGSDGAVVASWARAASALRRRGLGRRPAETLEEHAERFAAHVAGARGVPRMVGGDAAAGAGLADAAEAYRQLVSLAIAASYGPEASSDDDVTTASRLVETVCGALGTRPVAREPVGVG